MVHYRHCEQLVHTSIAEVWVLFADPHSLNTIASPDLSFRIVGETEGPHRCHARYLS